MIDTHVQHLLRQAVDSPIKLHLLLIFHEQSLCAVTPAQMAERACRDIWSVSQAMNELAEDGVLQVAQVAGEATYYYQPRPEYLVPIEHLMQHYNDPAERHNIRRSIRELAGHASFRRVPSGDFQI
jgi:thermostable 8-oxoguanine DNA glycosylase